MPTKNPRPDHVGDLFVNFRVVFPEPGEIGPEARKLLEQARAQRREKIPFCDLKSSCLPGFTTPKAAT